jgi:TM2 domain-containing membrane protein YozV
LRESIFPEAEPGVFRRNTADPRYPICNVIVAVTDTRMPQPESNKLILPAFLFCFCFGVLGVHAFYAGRAGQGMMYASFALLALLFYPANPLVSAVLLLFPAVFGIGDMIRIIARVYKDSQGCKITKWV